MATSLPDIFSPTGFIELEPSTASVEEKPIAKGEELPDIFSEKGVITPYIVEDPDSFLNKAGRSFNEFQKAMAEGVGVLGRTVGSKELLDWSTKNIQEQEEDIRSYGQPKRTSSITQGFEEVSKTYEDKGLGEAINRGAILLQDMLADAVGSMGLPVAAGLAAIPIGMVAGAGVGAATAILAPFMVGGLAGTGQVSSEAVQRGASQEEADIAGLIGGSIIGFLDRIGASAIIKPLVKEFGKDAVVKKLGEEVGEEVAKSAVDKALSFSAKTAATAGKAGVTEAATETAQEYVQLTAAGLASGKPYEAAEVRNRLLDAAALGFVGGFGAGGVSKAGGLALQRDAARKSEELDKTIGEIAKIAESSPDELASTYKIYTGLSKSQKDVQSTGGLGSLVKSAMSPLTNMARRTTTGANVFNTLLNYHERVSAAVGMDADALQEILTPLKRNLKLPFQRSIPKSISNRVFKVMTTQEPDSNARINEAAAEFRKVLGQLDVDPETGRVKQAVKLPKSELSKFIFEDGQLETVQTAVQENKLTQEEGTALLQEIQALKDQYTSRVQAAPQEENAIKSEIKKSDAFKNLSGRQIFTPNATGLYKRIVDAGIPLNFEEGYLPRLYRTGFGNRNKFIRVLTRPGTNRSKQQAINILDNIEQNEGFYNPEKLDINFDGVPINNRVKEAEVGLEQRRKLSKEDVQALEKAGLVETDIEGLLYKYILDANRKIEGKKMADYFNATIPEMYKNNQITAAEAQHIKDIFDATQHKYKPLDSRGLRNAQKWLLTSQYILTLPLAGLTALSEPLIILSRISPKYALFGAAQAAYNAYRAGLRTVFPKLKMKENERAFKGILEGLDGTLAERFGDLAGVTVSRKVTNAFFKATLLTTITQISRDMAFQATRLQIRNDLKKVATGRNTKEVMQARKRLAEQGLVKPLENEAIRQWADGETETDPRIIRMALSKTVNEFIMSPNATNRPLWMSDPHYASVAQLKGFMMVFGNTVGTRLWREVFVPLKKGRIPAGEAMKYAVALSSIVAVSMAIQGLKDAIRYGDEESPFDKMDGKEKMLRAVLNTNILGGFTLLHDALTAKEFGSSFWASILGPAASTIQGAAEGIYDYGAKGESRSLARWIANQIPLLRTIPLVRDIKQEFVDNLQDKLDDIRDRIVD